MSLRTFAAISFLLLTGCGQLSLGDVETLRESNAILRERANALAAENKALKADLQKHDKEVTGLQEAATRLRHTVPKLKSDLNDYMETHSFEDGKASKELVSSLADTEEALIYAANGRIPGYYASPPTAVKPRSKPVTSGEVNGVKWRLIRSE